MHYFLYTILVAKWRQIPHLLAVFSIVICKFMRVKMTLPHFTSLYPPILVVRLLEVAKDGSLGQAFE
jgi:hypothetical protein